MPIIQQILFTVILQLFFFWFYYYYGTMVSKMIGRRVCPTCFSVSSTWLVLLLLKYVLLIDINVYLVGLLLSQSVVGISYLTEEFLGNHNFSIPEPIMRFGIVIYGTFAVSVFAFVSQFIGLLLFSSIIIFGFWALTPNQK